MTRFDIVWVGEVLFGMYLLVTGIGTTLITLLGSPLTALLSLVAPIAGFTMMMAQPLTRLVFRSDNLRSSPS